MKTFAVVVGTIVILVLLISSGTIAAAFCVRGVGCVYSSGNGLQLDNASQVTVGIR